MDKVKYDEEIKEIEEIWKKCWPMLKKPLEDMNIEIIESTIKTIREADQGKPFDKNSITQFINRETKN